MILQFCVISDIICMQIWPLLVICCLIFHAFIIHRIDVTKSDKVYLKFCLSEAKEAVGI